MDCFVYILGCRGKGRRLTYVGWTTDLDRRLGQHNAGTGARFTRGRVWMLLHFETFATRREAMSREWHLKRDRKFRKQLAQTIGRAASAPLPSCRPRALRPRAARIATPPASAPLPSRA